MITTRASRRLGQLGSLLTLIWGLTFAALSEVEILHEFSNAADDGARPSGSLTLIGDALYGMTGFGGYSNFGVVFSIRTDGAGYTNLHEFVGNPDGRSPHGSLLSYSNMFYGMTSAGGTMNDGVVFRMAIDGFGYTNLHSFDDSFGSREGYGPIGSLVLYTNVLEGSNCLYGVSPHGGDEGYGVAFRLRIDGTGYGKLHDFDAWPNNGTGSLGGST